MIKHTIYAIAVGMLIFFLYLFQYTGAFKSVNIAIDQRGPYTIVYKEHTGAYHRIVSSIEEVEKWSREQGLKCRLSFGEYFDDPSAIEEGRLKSRGGCLIDPLVKEENTVLEKVKASLPADFKIDVIAETKAVVALFSGAPGIGPLKVYPKANDFIVKNKLTKKGSVIEIYEVFDSKSMQTTYLWPVTN
ncbi:MAG: AraC family transcriptional regulator [Bdellovibrio sp.]|nr:AraC family transcriptional regulator [Bdellovibrio sp.]